MIITVTQFNNFIKGVLDSEAILSDVWVKGEVTNFKLGYDCFYFSLKDNTSQVDCYYRLPKKDSGKVPVLENGAEIVCCGSPSYYVAYGRLNFWVSQIQPISQKGKQHLLFLQLKEKLEKEGLFDIQRKKSVPCDCARIGIVSSAKGAVIADIEQIALRRNPNVQLFLYPVKVQGENSPTSIAKAVDYFSVADVDAVIIARGGGSNEDLASFNSEVVVRAVARCTKPTVSAIGHGIDFTLCDFACDIATATPSEAAEILTKDSTLQKIQVRRAVERMYVVTLQKVSQCHSYLSLLLGKLNSLCSDKLLNTQLLLEKLSGKLSTFNPKIHFDSGYVIAAKNGARIKSVDDIAIGSELEIQFSNGKANVQVKDIKKTVK